MLTPLNNKMDKYGPVLFTNSFGIIPKFTLTK